MPNAIRFHLTQLFNLLMIKVVGCLPCRDNSQLSETILLHIAVSEGILLHFAVSEAISLHFAISKAILLIISTYDVSVFDTYYTYGRYIRV